jgi:hypothetical protein
VTAVGRRVRCLLVLLAFWWLPAAAFGAEPGEGQVLGERETIRVIAPRGTMEVEAKIDTGAGFSSIDRNLARLLGLRLLKRRIEIRGAKGAQERRMVRLTFILGDRRISTLATVADRRKMETTILVGRRDLEGFVVDPGRAFLVPPAEASPGPATFADWIRDVLRNDLLVLVPILGALVVLLRLLLGLKSYGIFAPVVIAISLMELEVLPGLLLYLYLVVVSVGVKVLILSRLRLLQIAEMSLIIFTLVLSIAALSALPLQVQVLLPEVFFPLIITAHVIERFTKSAEESQLREALPLLVETFAMAVALALAGEYLVELGTAALTGFFAASVAAVVLAGRYQGLRLSELLRFRLVRKSP